MLYLLVLMEKGTPEKNGDVKEYFYIGLNSFLEHFLLLFTGKFYIKNFITKVCLHLE